VATALERPRAQGPGSGAAAAVSSPRRPRGSSAAFGQFAHCMGAIMYHEIHDGEDAV
jgi:hypothetical protein